MVRILTVVGVFLALCSPVPVAAQSARAPDLEARYPVVPWPLPVMKASSVGWRTS